MNDRQLERCIERFDGGQELRMYVRFFGRSRGYEADVRIDIPEGVRSIAF